MMNLISSDEWPPPVCPPCRPSACDSASEACSITKTNGAEILRKASSGGATSSARRSAFSSARFFGTTSPITTCTRLIRRNATAKLRPCSHAVAHGCGFRGSQGWIQPSSMRYTVSSPAQPSPRLASVTPTCVVLSRRPGLASRPRAARAETLPCSASSLRREARTETSATSAAAKKPFRTTMAANKISRRDIVFVYNRSSVPHSAASSGQSEHSRFADRACGGGLLVHVAAPAGDLRPDRGAGLGGSYHRARCKGSAAHHGGFLGGRHLSPRLR